MAEIQKLIASYIPMSEPSFLVLYSLLHENHGYGIMQNATRLTQGRVSLGAGTVYTILYKMENDGLIEVTREVERRKLYCITPAGRKVLTAEMERIIQLYHMIEQTEG